MIAIYRFFVTNSDIHAGRVLLTAANAAHAAVLRLRVGEEIVVCDERGVDYFCRVDFASKTETRAEVVRSGQNAAEPAVRVTLYQALPKGDKMGEIVEKCVELGVSGIVPVVAARCVARPTTRDGEKVLRWRKIAEAAAKQSGRGRVPTVSGIIDLNAAAEQAKNHDAAFVCLEFEDKLTLKGLLRSLQAADIGVFVGPEGGFTEAEADLFKEHRIAAVSLGPRILRTQTAGPAVIAQILYELEGRS